jgi:hypothetical protein
MDEAMAAYDVFGDAAKTHALKVVLNGTAVSGRTKTKVAATASV